MTASRAYGALPASVREVKHADHEHEDHCLRCTMEREWEYQAQAADLRRRIDRTVEYAQTIRPLIRGEEAQGALSAIIKSLTTPSDSGESGAPDA